MTLRIGRGSEPVEGDYPSMVVGEGCGRSQWQNGRSGWLPGKPSGRCLAFTRGGA